MLYETDAGEATVCARADAAGRTVLRLGHPQTDSGQKEGPKVMLIYESLLLHLELQ